MQGSLIAVYTLTEADKRAQFFDKKSTIYNADAFVKAITIAEIVKDVTKKVEAEVYQSENQNEMTYQLELD